MMNRFTVCVLFLIAFVAMTSAVPYHPKPVRLRDVEALTFTAGEYTSARRSSAIPKLSCISGPCQYAPSSAMCKNVGWDGTDVQWKCEAELPKGIKLGSISVSCEGFNFPDDDYVLGGSCGLEYSLIGDRPVHQTQTVYASHTESTWFGDLVTLAALGVILYIVYRMIFPNYYSSWSTIPGLGSFYTWMQQPSAYNGPPPPYQSASAPGNYNDKSYPHNAYAYTSPQSSYWSYVPNVLSGLAGYALGSFGNRQTYHQPQPVYAHQPVYTQPPVHTYTHTNPSTHSSAYPSESIRTETIRNRDNLSRTSPISDSHSKTTQTSTAYGSTKRR